MTPKKLFNTRQLTSADDSALEEGQNSSASKSSTTSSRKRKRKPVEMEEFTKQYKQFFRQLERPPRQVSSVSVLVVAVVAGLVAGMVGQLFFASPFAQRWLLGEFLFDHTISQPAVIVEDNKEITVLSDDLTAEVVRGVTPGVGGLFRGALEGGAAASLLSSVAVLSSDGWLLTTLNEKTMLKSQGSLVVGLTNGKRVVVKETVSDPVSEAVFLRTEEKDLTALPLNYLTTLPTPGQRLWAIFFAKPQPWVYPVTLAGIGSKSSQAATQRKSEELGNYLLVASLADLPAGALVVDKAGQLMGMTVADKERTDGLTPVLPVAYLKNALTQTLKDGAVKRVYLGVVYQDLARFVFLPPALTRQQGAWLEGAQAVAANSPAARAGLRKGDIITAVESERLNHFFGLAELIQQYRPGQTIALTVEREGEEETVSVKLEELGEGKR